MTEKDLFELHQEILSDLLNARPMDEKFEKKIREFLLITEAKIDAHVNDIGGLSYQLRKIEGIVKDLCSMRDLIRSERTKRNVDDYLSTP